MNKAYYYITLALTVFGNILFSSCDNNDDGYLGDPFDDVEEAYILTPETSPSTKLPQKDDGSPSYSIRNASDLKLFIDMANTGYDFGDYATIEICHDLTISEKFKWTPIGDVQNPVYANIDGKGHTIKGVMNAVHAALGATAEVDGTKYGNSLYGFFGYASGSISNLNLELNLLFRNTNIGTYSTIGILGGVLSSNISNVHIDGDILFDTRVSGNTAIIGGLAGLHMYGAITDCTTKGKIDISIQPIKANDYGLKMDYAYIGGIAGQQSQGTSEKCTAQMDITLDNCAIKGVLGIGGYLGRTSYMNVPVINGFTNHGNISLSNIYKLRGIEEQMIAVGGVFGYNEGTTLAPANVINTGNINVEKTSHTAYIGGFEGFNIGGDLTTGSNKGDISNSAKRGYTGGCFGLIISGANRNSLENRGNVSSQVFTDDRSEENGGLSIYSRGISGYTGGIAGAIVNKNDRIKDATNHGTINTPAAFEEYGEDISLAGAIVGYGSCEYGTCLNYGKVNGRQLDNESNPRIFVGYLWYPWEKMDTGAINEGHPYWNYWKEVFNGYQFW